MRGTSVAQFAVAALILFGCGRDAAAALPSPASRALAAVAPVELEPDSPGREPLSAPPGAGLAALDALSWVERLPLEQALALSDARYAPRMDEGGPVLETPGSIIATFGASGAELSFGGHAVTLSLVALGRGGSLVPLAPGARPEVSGA